MFLETSSDVSSLSVASALRLLQKRVGEGMEEEWRGVMSREGKTKGGRGVE